jgi:hypothetical protein
MLEDELRTELMSLRVAQQVHAVMLSSNFLKEPLGIKLMGHGCRLEGNLEE